MQKKMLLTLSLVFSGLCIQANDNQLDQVSQELEGFMNEDFEDHAASRSGKIDKDYDVICDQTPVKAVPKWQQWLSSISGSIIVHAASVQQFIRGSYTKAIIKISSLIKSKSSNGCSNGSK